MRSRRVVAEGTVVATTTTLTPRQTRCGCPKQGYTNRKAAATAAAFARRVSDEVIEAYRCRHGGHCWHIGHPPGSRSEAA